MLTACQETVQEPWARDLISKVGKAIVGGGASAIDVFHRFDKDESGFLEYDEFAEAVRVLEAGPDASPGTRRQSSGGTPLGPSADQLEQLARLVDVDGHGRVNIWQFTAAFVAHDQGTSSASSNGPDHHHPSFSPDGSKNGAVSRQLSLGVVQAVAGTIFSHRSILRKAWSVWDDDADGVVRF